MNIPFTQLGEFVYHCHIVAHEDGGMIARIVVVPSPNRETAQNDRSFSGVGRPHARFLSPPV
jgi:hypothetical protein